MRNLKKSLALLLALALVLALTACGKGTDAPAATPAPIEKPADTPAPATPAPTEAPSPAGYYVLTKSVVDGEEEDMEQMNSLGIFIYLVFEEDGTGCLDSFGTQTPLNWDETTFTVHTTGEDGDEDQVLPYTFAYDAIHVEADGTEMVFSRLTGDALDDYLENGSGLGALGDVFGSFESTPFEMGEVSDGPVYGSVGDFDVAFLGAEAVRDYEDKPAIRFYFEVTNNSDRLISAFSEVYFNAQQDGVELEGTFTGWDEDETVPEDNNSSVMFAPGHSIRATMIVLYDPDGGTVGIRGGEFFGDEYVYYYVDPQNLPGPPADAFAFGEDGSVPEFMLDAPEGDESVEILDVETVPDWDGNDILRVYFRFTNRSDETTSMMMRYDVYAMQDGYQLEDGNADEYVDEEDNYYEDIAPGESIECARCFAPRSHSPIAIAVKESFNSEAPFFGTVLSFNE